MISCSFLDRESLSDSDIQYITGLDLLDNGEEIVRISSTSFLKSEGNFITDKRLVSYWIDSDTTKSFKKFAYYSDIIDIVAVDKSQSWTRASYLTIKKRDGSQFNLYVDGDSLRLNSFRETAFDYWEKTK